MNNTISVIKRSGEKAKFDEKKIRDTVKRACKGLKNVDSKLVIYNAEVKLYDGVTTKEIDESLIKSARALVEEDPEYKFVAARLLLFTIYKSCFGQSTDEAVFDMHYRACFKTNFNRLIKEGIINPEMRSFDFKTIVDAIRPERDNLFAYEGLAAVSERYLSKVNDRIIETPQAWLMRVAMGLALREDVNERTAKAIEFYELISTFSYMCSTPTLFYSGTTRNQLSSCFLNTFEDSIFGIFDGLHQEAQKSKFAGGLGMDLTPFRAGNAYINGTNGYTQGAVFFWKLFNDMLVAVNQCFPSDTKVITKSGIKKIKDIVPGEDYALSCGGWRIVEDKMHYPQEGKELVHIKLRHSYEKISATGGHPFYIITGSQTTKNESHSQIIKKLDSGQLKVEWAEAKDLQVDQFVGFPIPTETEPHSDWSIDDAKMYGLMLGDGWVTKKKTEMGICFNSETNADTIEFAAKYLSDKGINYWTCNGADYKNTSDKYLSFVWSYSKHSEKIPFNYDDMYGDGRQKRVSARLLTMRNELIHYIIAGLILSDGHVHFNKEITFYNNSEELIDTVRYLLLKVGVLCGGNMNEGKVNGNSKLNGIRNVDSNDSYVLRIPAYKELADILDIKPLSKKHWLTYNGMLFTRIKSITHSSEEFPIDLYDLKINGTPSYTLISGGLVHNGGKRRGAGCGYLETWHYDIEDFLVLKKNVGDERRRTHDMNTANWIPDLFMKQVSIDGPWYLFSPDETPDLHSLFGDKFETKYWEYVEKGKQGKLRLFKEVSAKDLWKKMLAMLFETGHPWITFKDPSNIRYSNQHAGVVNSSNLCTEILLHSKPTVYEENNNRAIKEYGETAVCNLGSINLKNHIIKNNDGTCSIDYDKLAKTIETGMRMLDNVIDINFYPTQEAKNSNTRHRPVGMGTMGWHDLFIALNIGYDSREAVDLSDKLYEFISYHTILASSKLSKERGKYSTYEGSLWDQNKFPIDTYFELMQHRDNTDPSDDYFVKRGEALDWSVVRDHVRQYGMRNSNTMAIAPTATISQITGCSSCTEPYFNVLFVRSVLGGDFTVINEWFVEDMKKIGLWSHAMVTKIKQVDGDLSRISEIPEDIALKYRDAFNMDQFQLLKAAAARGKWIDMGMSVNLFNNKTSAKYLNELYMTAWNYGLKTTYYLRNKSASQVEKASTVIDNSTATETMAIENLEIIGKACRLDDPTCESCQ